MFTSLKKLFTPLKFNQVVVFHMKSGKVFKVPCTFIEWTVNSETGSINSYRIELYETATCRYVNLNEIEFITSESYSIFKKY